RCARMGPPSSGHRNAAGRFRCGDRSKTKTRHIMKEWLYLPIALAIGCSSETPGAATATGSGGATSSSSSASSSSSSSSTTSGGGAAGGSRSSGGAGTGTSGGGSGGAPDASMSGGAGGQGGESTDAPATGDASAEARQACAAFATTLCAKLQSCTPF